MRVGAGAHAAVRNVVRMSLVVVDCSDDEAHANDDARTRATFDEALPKIVLLRPDLAVGVTGDDPHRVIEALASLRDASIDDLLAHLVSQTSASFVVAALKPARLWMVSDGRVDERTTEVHRAWAGDRTAFNHFQARFHDWPDDTDVPFRLLSSMQWLTSFEAVESVGGYSVRVATVDGGFEFVADWSFVGPWMLEAAMSVSDSGASLRATVPAGGDATTHRIVLLPGADPTRGALGLLIPEASVGLIFPHEQPWEPLRVASTSPGELAGLAWERHQQVLKVPEVPAQIWLPL